MVVPYPATVADVPGRWSNMLTRRQLSRGARLYRQGRLLLQCGAGGAPGDITGATTVVAARPPHRPPRLDTLPRVQWDFLARRQLYHHLS